MSVSVSMDSHALSGKIIPAQFVRMHDGNSAVPGLCAAPSALAAKPDRHLQEPKITLVKDGDTVTTIEIECACGALIRLECEY
jgi:hypothetical protein